LTRAASLFLGMFVLSGCTPLGAPTQDNPTCSWSSAVPRGADATCLSVFRTLSRIARAEQRGDEKSIRTLAPVPKAARRMIAEGRSLRSQHASGLHVVPSVTLRANSPNRVEAQYFLLGKTPSGRINQQEGVTLRVHGGSAVITRAQPPVLNDQSGEG
jgi:hypothetical protein